MDGVCERDEGMTRLGALAEGVRAGVLADGVFVKRVAADRVLSLLRERFDDEGDAGTTSGAAMPPAAVSRPPLSLALRRSARSLCSLNVFLPTSGAEVSSGSGGTTKFEGGILTALGRIPGARGWRVGCAAIGHRASYGVNG
jgi:hypothetical protein